MKRLTFYGSNTLDILACRLRRPCPRLRWSTLRKRSDRKDTWRAERHGTCARIIGEARPEKRARAEDRAAGLVAMHADRTRIQ